MMMTVRQRTQHSPLDIVMAPLRGCASFLRSPFLISRAYWPSSSEVGAFPPASGTAPPLSEHSLHPLSWTLKEFQRHPGQSLNSTEKPGTLGFDICSDSSSP